MTGSGIHFPLIEGTSSVEWNFYPFSSDTIHWSPSDQAAPVEQMTLKDSKREWWSCLGKLAKNSASISGKFSLDPIPFLTIVTKLLLEGLQVEHEVHHLYSLPSPSPASGIHRNTHENCSSLECSMPDSIVIILKLKGSLWKETPIHYSDFWIWACLKQLFGFDPGVQKGIFCSDCGCWIHCKENFISSSFRICQVENIVNLLIVSLTFQCTKGLLVIFMEAPIVSELYFPHALWLCCLLNTIVYVCSYVDVDWFTESCDISQHFHTWLGTIMWDMTTR